MRKFEKTHPWIRFSVDLRQAPPSLWLLLGEATSKIEHLGKVPLQPDTHNRLHQLYVAKGVAATTAIEGNTLSEADVLRAVEGTLTVPPSQEYLKQEVDNIIGAYRHIVEQLATGKLAGLTVEEIADYNRRALDRLPGKDDSGTPGEIRHHSVVVGAVYRGAPAEDCRHLLGRLCDWLNGSDFAAPRGMEMPFTILKALLGHLYVAWIHPFGDGNGRTARLVELRMLLGGGVPTPAAHLLSNHYNLTRTEYYRQLALASKSGGDVLPFIEYAVRGFVDGLRQQLDEVWKQQYDVIWEKHVHTVFDGINEASARRQRDLALALGRRADEWIDESEVVELTPSLLRQYLGKSAKTLARDLDKLTEAGLVDLNRNRVRARREVVLTMLPLRRPNTS